MIIFLYIIFWYTGWSTDQRIEGITWFERTNEIRNVELEPRETKLSQTGYITWKSVSSFFVLLLFCFFTNFSCSIILFWHFWIWKIFPSNFVVKSVFAKKKMLRLCWGYQWKIPGDMKNLRKKSRKFQVMVKLSGNTGGQLQKN